MLVKHALLFDKSWSRGVEFSPTWPRVAMSEPMVLAIAASGFMEDGDMHGHSSYGCAASATCKAHLIDSRATHHLPCLRGLLMLRWT
ncbi:hypothetical protein V6N13_087270 [Hibiscus sabdariffa]|uniref:Uncharacterized protein n=1 Tax=Hibiscus sabdariffa TaxID=183260 RepID=A0ABR2FW22_9ROSI